MNNSSGENEDFDKDFVWATPVPLQGKEKTNNTITNYSHRKWRELWPFVNKFFAAVSVLYVLVAVSFSAIFFALVFDEKTLNNNVAVGLCATICGEILALWALLGSVHKKFIISGQEFKDSLSIATPKFSKILFSILAGLGVFVISSVMTYFFKDVGLHPKDSDTSTSVYHTSGWQHWFVLFFLVSFVAPIVEELIFRGFVFTAFQEGCKNHGKLYGLIFSTVFFGILHAQGKSSTDLLVPITIGVCGLMNGIMRWKTNNVVYSIVMHMVFNLTSVILMIVAYH